MKTIGKIIGVIIGILAITWAIQGNDFFMYKVFGLRYEQTRRQIFEESKAYNQGMVQELQNMQFTYEQASPEHKQALGSIILHRAADYNVEANWNRMPVDLKQFLAQLKAERRITQ